jgi:RNA-directed DNA polymerase
MTRAIRKVAEWCRLNRHCQVAEQFKGLVLKLRGHYQYYGITALHSFYESVRRVWHRWLNRRSQRYSMTWERFERLLQHDQLPEPVIVHSVYRAQRTCDPRSRMH